MTATVVHIILLVFSIRYTGFPVYVAVRLRELICGVHMVGMNVRSIRYKISIPSILSADSSRDIGQDVRFARGMSRLTQAFTPLWKEIKPKSCWLNPTILGNDSLPKPRCVLKTSLSRASGCVGSRGKNAAPVFRIANIETKVQKPVSGAKATALPSLILKRDCPFQHFCQRLGMGPEW